MLSPPHTPPLGGGVWGGGKNVKYIHFKTQTQYNINFLKYMIYIYIYKL